MLSWCPALQSLTIVPPELTYEQMLAFKLKQLSKTCGATPLLPRDGFKWSVAFRAGLDRGMT
jgi:hypothetical protein